ncbi:MAG: ATP-dependent helicase HrpB [Desulfuromonas sp.]|nr:ATP-dependent helicase HrpB [Desulfuromonas sp.]
MTLPIDHTLPQLLNELSCHASVVLQAEPGAGKTTRVPLALLDQPWLAGQKILMLEPRRLAAVHAARYMSQLLGEEPGQTVGYTIRHQRAVSRRTRIEVVTEGVLTRRLQQDPTLDGVRLIIFDEFHERNLHSDLGLALSYDVQQGLRDDLKILVMSATLDGQAIAAHLGHCPVLHSVGRSFPVDISYQGDGGGDGNSTALARQVVKAVRVAIDDQTLGDQQGDILVFLPGAREIRSCQRQLASQSWADELAICPLYGALPFAEQQQAIRPASQRKIILATNIAETSLTIDGVGTVIDSGLERQLTFDAASGMDRLLTRPISRASATQRAGRAGRLAAGRCYRLWSENRQQGLLDYSVPEIRRTDLSSLALELVAWGINDAAALSWLDVPPRAHLDAAFRLLQQLGAIDGKRRLTAIGAKMARLPLHPRLARMVVAANSDDKKTLACQLAVILDSSQLFSSQHREGRATDSDLLDRLEAWLPHRRQKMTSPAMQTALKNYQALCRQLGHSLSIAPLLDSEHVGRLLLVAFPDRVAKQRSNGSGEYLLRGGRGAQLSRRSHLIPSPWLVAAEVEHGHDSLAMIHQASQISSEQLLELFADQMPWQTETVWDSASQRVIARDCRRFGALIVAARPATLRAENALPLLIEQLQRQGLEGLNWSKDSRSWLQRARFVAGHDLESDWPSLADADLLDGLDQWLAPWLSGVTTMDKLKKIDLLDPLRSLLTWSQQQRLDQLAPQKIAVPSGSQIRIDYSDPQQPKLAVKLQELFGWQQGPRIGHGRVALLLQLLSPAQRPIQLTADLANFWATTYDEVKKELKGRYPKHPWPDDPLQAPAQRGVKRRR